MLETVDTAADTAVLLPTALNCKDQQEAGIKGVDFNTIFTSSQTTKEKPTRM